MTICAYAATMQSVWFGHDEGTRWARLMTPTGGFYNEARCWAVCTHAARSGELLAGTDQGLYRYVASAGRFDYVPSPMDDLHILQVERHPDDPDFIVCGTRPSELFISDDNGKHWRQSCLDSATECWFINTPRMTSIHFDPRDRDTLWVTIEIDGVFRSTDRGVSWTRLVDGLKDCDTHDLVFIDRDDGSRVLLCSTEAGLHKSVDDGEHWLPVEVPESVAPWAYWRSIKQRADNRGVILASVGDRPSGEAGVMLLSEDAGETWRQTQLSHPVNSTIWSIATHPANAGLLFFATIFGQIYRSDDGGESWQKLERELGEIRQIAWAPAGQPIDSGERQP
ncbi:MAG: YCF48-related protein [Pseudomonadota bacterium]